MTSKKYLDYSLKIYFEKTLKLNKFELIDSNIGGMSGIYYFRNSTLNFNILNERGIILTSISSIYSKKEFDFNIINALLQEKTENKANSSKREKYDFLKSLNLKQESSLFESNIELLMEIFNKENYKKTELELKKFQKIRAKIIFD